MATNNRNTNIEPQARLPSFTDSHAEFDRGMEDMRRELTQAQTAIRSFMYGIWGGLPKVDVTFERPRVPHERENVENKDNEKKGSKLTWRTVEREDGGRSFKVKIDWPKEEDTEEIQKVSTSALDTSFERNDLSERIPIWKSQDEDGQTNSVMKTNSLVKNYEDGDNYEEYDDNVLSVFNKRERDILSGREGPTSLFDMFFSKESPFYEKKLGLENMDHNEETWHTHNAQVKSWRNSDGEVKGFFTQTTRKTIVRPDGTREIIVSESVDGVTESTHKIWHPDGTYEETADRVEWPARPQIPVTPSNDSPSKISEVENLAELSPVTNIKLKNESFVSKIWKGIW